jgi:RNase P/RNase MRP subunit POP5
LSDAFYRRQIRAKVGSMIAKWEPILQVKVNRVPVQRMKTKWGSCATASRNIRLGEKRRGRGEGVLRSLGAPQSAPVEVGELGIGARN